jgi:hypothetical protein
MLGTKKYMHSECDIYYSCNIIYFGMKITGQLLTSSKHSRKQTNHLGAQGSSKTPTNFQDIESFSEYTVVDLQSEFTIRQITIY